MNFEIHKLWQGQNTAGLQKHRIENTLGNTKIPIKLMIEMDGLDKMVLSEMLSHQN